MKNTEFYMDFSLSVMFEYNIKKGAVCQRGQFSDVFNLRDIVQNSLNYDSFELILTKTVLAKKYAQDQNPVVLDSKKINIIVTDELTYPRDVRRFLKQKYNNTFNFDELKLPALNPVYFGGVREIEELGDINPNTGDRTTYTRRYVECRTLNDKDIVVDKNLLKLFPVSANLLPWTIINFFNTQINIH